MFLTLYALSVAWCLFITVFLYYKHYIQRDIIIAPEDMIMMLAIIMFIAWLPIMNILAAIMFTLCANANGYFTRKNNT